MESGANSIAASSAADYKIHNGNTVDVENASSDGGDEKLPSPSSPLRPQEAPVSQFDRTKSLCANGLMLLFMLSIVGAIVAFGVLFMIDFLDSTEIGPTGIIVFVFFLIFLFCLVPRVSSGQWIAN